MYYKLSDKEEILNYLEKSELFNHSLRKNTTNGLTISNHTISQLSFLPHLSRLINKYLYNLPVIGLGSSLCRYTNTFNIYSSKEDRKRYKIFDKKAVFANFGSGAFYHKKWTNFDFPGVSKYYKSLLGTPNKDFIPIDLCDKNLKIPLDDNSTSLIYMSHVLEHLEESNGEKVFQEFQRILKPNGVFRLVIPDDHKFMYYSKCLNNEKNLSKDLKELSTWSSIVSIFKEAANQDPKKLYELAVENDYCIEKIAELLSNEIKDLKKFKASNPERHITHWSDKKLFRISKKSNFNHSMLLHRGHTNAKPFENINVFDMSENQYSRFFEFIK
tara:strand:- start:102 stop:1088 length:987 start_codon:yes stop_codon:yes gene_type:complete